MTGEPSTPFVALAERLVDSYLDPDAREMQHIGSYELPSEDEVERVVEMARALLFPGYAGPDVARTDRASCSTRSIARSITSGSSGSARAISSASSAMGARRRSPIDSSRACPSCAS